MNARQAKTTRIAVVLVAGLFVTVGTMLGLNFVNVLTTNFELGPGSNLDEGGLSNILGNGTDPGPDWADLFDATGNFIGATGTGAFIKDDISASSLVDNTVYSGGPGDKNSDVIGDWTWSSSSVPAKDDISNTYAYTTIEPGGQKMIWVAVEREVASGDSHIDIEFFQNGIALDHNPPCPIGQCGFTGSNKNGDLLVNMDFSNGGSFGTLSIRKRQSGTKDNYVLVDTLTGEGCHDVNGAVGEGGINIG